MQGLHCWCARRVCQNGLVTSSCVGTTNLPESAVATVGGCRSYARPSPIAPVGGSTPDQLNALALHGMAIAKLRQQAAVEDIDYRTPRGLDRSLLAMLVEGGWIAHHANLPICGPPPASRACGEPASPAERPEPVAPWTCRRAWTTRRALPTCPQQEQQKNQFLRAAILDWPRGFADTRNQTARTPRAPGDGRDHLGILGEIKSVHPGEIIGIAIEKLAVACSMKR